MKTSESNEQLFFDFSGNKTTESKDAIKAFELKRAVMGWLIPQAPSGFALGVPTRISKFKADIAAFWSVPKKKLMKPEKTVIIEVRHDRENCWPECSRKEELLPKLREIKELKKSLEEKIRRDEPHLKDTDNLFDEYESWDFTKTKNRDYHKCCRQIDDTEHALYNGSRFEQIRRANTADYLYLAVPSGTVHQHELADGWGLLYIEKDMSVKLVKGPDKWTCPEDNKLHLIQNIAISSSKCVLFANGIREDANGSVFFTPIPRKRRGVIRIEK